MKKLLLILVTILLVACSSDTGEPGSKAGTYEGGGQGFGGEITVEVTLDEEGTITNVEVKDHNESVNDIEQVPLALEEVPARIVASNSAEVDITSGATATSNGIMEAVEDALSKAE